MTWGMADTWIVVAGALAGMACALPGTFLVLRRMSMMGDAISHAVLPGIAIAFAVSHSRSGPPLVIGAVLAGLLSALLTQLLNKSGQVEEGASMGVVFTLMFAAGLVILEQVARFVDLDVDCVLFGIVELVPLAPAAPWLDGVPAPVARLMVVLGINALVVCLFFKEWVLSSFDEELANAIGVSASRMHYLLMVITSVTTVYCFEIVGSILVIAMLIVPAACARMLTDRMGPTLCIAVALSAVFALLGHVAALTIPGWWGYEDTASSGAMAVVAGFCFLLCVIFAPRHGILRRLLHQWSLHLHTLEEDILGTLYRVQEAGGGAGTSDLLEERRRLAGVRPGNWRRVLRRLRQRGWIGADLHLTGDGRRAGARLLRSHRLWEGWLHEHTALEMDHLHLPAEELEHITDDELRKRLADELSQTQMDPMGKRIPPGRSVRSGTSPE